MSTGYAVQHLPLLADGNFRAASTKGAAGLDKVAARSHQAVDDTKP